MLKIIALIFQMTNRFSDGTPEVDKHPEKRMKAAYEDFEKLR